MGGGEEVGRGGEVEERWGGGAVQSGWVRAVQGGDGGSTEVVSGQHAMPVSKAGPGQDGQAGSLPLPGASQAPDYIAALGWG